MSEHKRKLGATGTFSHGRLGSHDEGDLRMSVSHDEHGNVHVNFGKQIAWFALPPKLAIELARLILRHALPGSGGLRSKHKQEGDC
jgi:hypothetical protein